MDGLPREVASVGRTFARRCGLDDADGESIAAEAWWAHPDCWRTVAYRQCVDEARHRDGRRERRPHPLLLGDDVRGDDAAAGIAATDDPGFDDVDNRCLLANRVAHLDDTELAALARVYWLGMPFPSGAGSTAPLRALRHARAGPKAPPPPPPPPPMVAALTPRQLEVVALLAEGLTRPQIAERLTIAEHTVKTTIARAVTRANATGTTHLVALALRGGWIA